jgi:hypothetical protein
MIGIHQSPGTEVDFSEKRYESSLGLWLIVRHILFPLGLMVTGAALVLLQADEQEGLGLALAALGLVLIIGTFIFVLPRRYIIRADDLMIQQGLFRKRVPLARIRSALLTGNPQENSGNRRVRLTMDSGKRIIDPQNRVEFIKTLKERAYL